jgi:hypothetical protein
MKQLTQIQAGKPNSVQANYVYDPIDMHFKDELKEYRMSRQLTTEIDNSSFDRFYLLILLVSSIGVLAIFSRIPDRQHLAFIYATIIGYIICNAFVTATFANVLDRLNNRVFWLLPATNITILCRYWGQKWMSTPRN